MFALLYLITCYRSESNGFHHCSCSSIDSPYFVIAIISISALPFQQDRELSIGLMRIQPQLLPLQLSDSTYEKGLILERAIELKN
jgi:hypothetical protein